MTRMTGPDCAVMCNLINTQNTHRHTVQRSQTAFIGEVHKTASDILCITHDTYSLHTNINGGSGKREAHKNWSLVKPEKATPVTGTTLRTTGPVSTDSRLGRERHR